VDASDDALQFPSKRTCNIIVATAVLNNICIDNEVPNTEERDVITEMTMSVVEH
jgi:hypothetical protein